MNNKKFSSPVKMLAYNKTLKILLAKITALESDEITPLNEKISEIKKIKEEISKVGMEIDNAEKELTLSKSYTLN